MAASGRVDSRRQAERQEDAARHKGGGAPARRGDGCVHVRGRRRSRGAPGRGGAHQERRDLLVAAAARKVQGGPVLRACAHEMAIARLQGVLFSASI